MTIEVSSTSTSAELGNCDPGPVSFGADRVAVLRPGQWLAESAPGQVQILLGSCICVTLWSPARQVGAACHVMLPEVGETTPADARYARFALDAMAERLQRLGAPLASCEAKLFGGGRQWASQQVDIGSRNIDSARAWLAAHQLPLLAEDVGRGGYRRLRFNLADGHVQVQFTAAAALQPGASHGRR